MGLNFRSIFRLNGNVENDVTKVINTFILNKSTGQFPPQDEFNYLGKEEICVTLAVLVVSYIILAIPTFYGRPNKQQRQQARIWSSKSNVGWSHTFKELLYIRSVNDFRDWWDELKNQRRSLHQKRSFHSKSFEKFMQSEASRLQLHDTDETVRARGDGGVDVPHTPLRAMFKVGRKRNMHASASDGKFNTTADNNSSAQPPPDLIERFYSHAQKNGITASAIVDSFYEDADFCPETDHDRFVSAWESHIRFSQYRRLVLPPTCKLYRPSPVTYHNLFDRREIERNLHLLVDESTWRKILSYFRNLYDIFDKIVSKLLNKQSTEKFSEHMMNVFRYRIRKRRGLPVEEDEEDDDDDGSVTTVGSSSTAGRRATLRSSSTQSEVTPVVTNRKEIVANVPPLALDALQTTDIPRLLIPPSLSEEENIEVEDIKPPQDNKGHVTFTFIDSTNDEKRDEPPFESVRHLFPPPTLVDDSTRDEDSDVGERQQVKEILNDVIKEIEDDEVRVDSVSMMSVDFDDGTSSPRPRFHTASNIDVNDDISFVTSTEQNQEMPVSAVSTPKTNASPLPIKSFAKVEKEDALGNDPNPTAPSVPMLKPIAVTDSQSGRVSPMPSPKVKRNNSFDNAANMMFFDTANSNRQLADMSRDVPIPDSGGYILGDEFLGSSCTPLLVFINSRSGSQQGDLLITQFRRLLNPIQIWDLANGGPEKVLKSFSVLSRFQVLICGGDGTVSWIISALEKMELKRWPPIGILPLGTGNDLARVHGWGGGYNNESLLYILKQISEAYISMLDLWELDITTVNKKGKTRKEVKAFLNYLGVGVDAQAALQVHNLRESKPKLFFSRFFNKAYYALAGGEEAIKNSCTNISEQITLVADGIEIPLPPDSQGIIFLNIDSYSGGVPMWSNGLRPRRKARSYSEGHILNGSKSFPRNDSIDDLADYEVPKELSFEEKVAKLTACDKQSSCQDGLLDVVSVRGAFHLGQIRVGLGNADLLCQCREATITLKKNFAVQIDGEPWRQTQSTLSIRRKPDRATMLHRSVADNGGVESEVTKLLNWANEKEIIDRNQYAEIMGEFSRRAEFKKVKKQQDKTW
mmetsp:Transcript_3785/g.8075  ORF Transcript_3785/g.8075 Transcript_3785/m.8075 type:complete len:1089 (-) Transcript_3785:134-3400(-)